MNEIGAEAASAVSAFLKGLDQLVRDTGIELEPSYGGISWGEKAIGNLRRSGAVFVLETD